MLINNIKQTYGVYQQKDIKNNGRISRKEEKSDLVNLSSMAKDYNKVRSALKDLPDVRADKVNDIKNRIDTGNYNVDSSMLADKIIADYFA